MIHTATLSASKFGPDDIPSDPASKDYVEFRDRAAYVYVTGSFPTHLRVHYTGLLRLVTRYNKEPVSLDQRTGHMAVNKEAVEKLMLEDHPMVRKVRAMIDKGYLIERSDSLTERRPYGRVPMFHPTTKERVAVQSDGSVRDL